MFKRRKVPVHEVPTDIQNVPAEFYSSQKFEFFTVDSAYCFSSKNSFVFLSPIEKNASAKFACSIHSLSRILFLCMSSM